MIFDPANALFNDHWRIIHDVPEEMIEQVNSTCGRSSSMATLATSASTAR